MQNNLKNYNSPFTRSLASKLVEQVETYSLALERVTALRNKAFTNWTMKNHKEFKEQSRQEWERYNDLIAVMQTKLIVLHGNKEK